MQSNKGIISYNLAHGIKSIKQHVVNEHGATLNRYKEQKKTTNEEGGGRQKREKRKTMPPHSIIDFYA